MNVKSKTIIVSGANITGGGPLEVYRAILRFLSFNYQDVNVIAIVNNKQLFDCFDNVCFIEIKNYKRFIFLKFYYEYFRYSIISKKHRSILWLSLNDCTPSVKSEIRAVYCHNATPFYKRSVSDYFNPSVPFVQSFYYQYFYKINLKKNSFIIVQQDWLRTFFKEKFKIEHDKIIVTPPTFTEEKYFVSGLPQRTVNNYIFIYPTKAQPYKNISIICEAAKILDSLGISNFQILFTIDGKENKFSRSLFKRYKHLKAITWIGMLTREQLEGYYLISDCLIFPSKLETWGLPITEYKKFEKPILVADLNYARETVGNYNFVKFIDVNDSMCLAMTMKALIQKEDFKFDKPHCVVPELPFAGDLTKLFQILLKNRI